MNISLVINSDAGSLSGKDVLDIANKVCTAFQKAGHDCRPYISTANTLNESLKDVVRNTEALIVGGGDGTIVAAANAALGRGIALGILPLGTVNVLAKDLSIPSDLENAVESLAYGHIKEIDVGMVNGQLFLVAVVLGVFVDLVKRREETRSDTGPLKWPSLLAEMGKNIFNAEPMFLTLDVNQKRARASRCRVSVGMGIIEFNGKFILGKN
jgi:diacylglycerol kinase family enzyme